jgi:L-alanine-DL-glutamate epimerase-like enolase superfamily enzyme
MPDLVWTGGLTEARKIAALADTHYLPITTHDTIGPVALWASTHLALHASNAMIVETVRGYYLGWYNEVMTRPLSIADGYLTLDERPGLGTVLREEVLQRSDVHVEVTTQATRRDVSRG